MDLFVVKSFSEYLCWFMEKGLGGQDNQLFLIKSCLKEVLCDCIDDSIFYGVIVIQEVYDLKKCIVINVGGVILLYMVWFVGQCEFMFFLFSFYWLMFLVGLVCCKGVDWVVIEELEMGFYLQVI